MKAPMVNDDKDKGDTDEDKEGDTHGGGENGDKEGSDNDR